MGQLGSGEFPEPVLLAVGQFPTPPLYARIGNGFVQLLEYILGCPCILTIDGLIELRWFRPHFEKRHQRVELGRGIGDEGLILQVEHIGRIQNGESLANTGPPESRKHRRVDALWNAGVSSGGAKAVATIPHHVDKMRTRKMANQERKLFHMLRCLLDEPFVWMVLQDFYDRPVEERNDIGRLAEKAVLRFLRKAKVLSAEQALCGEQAGLPLQ